MKYAFTAVPVIVSFISSGQIPSYYSDTDLTLSGTELRDALSTKLQTSVFIPYTSGIHFDTWDALRICDENPDNEAEVLLIYGWEDGSDGDVTNDRSRGKFDNGNAAGLWNREHVFPRSRAVPPLTTENPGPGTDIHNLRPCDVQTNTLRSNLKFIAGNGNAGITGEGWYPGDEWKGDAARMVMYMYLRYNGDGSSPAETSCLPTETGIGAVNDVDPNMVNLFLEWNAADPVSETEIARNALSEIHQNNRNPFIDNPALATAIWGGPLAEDFWEILPPDPSTFEFELDAMVLNNGVILQWTALPGSVGCQVKGGIAGGSDSFVKNINQAEASSLFVPEAKIKPGRSYQWRVRCALGNNPVTGLTPFSDYHVFDY